MGLETGRTHVAAPGILLGTPVLLVVGDGFGIKPHGRLVVVRDDILPLLFGQVLHLACGISRALGVQHRARLSKLSRLCQVVQVVPGCAGCQVVRLSGWARHTSGQTVKVLD